MARWGKPDAARELSRADHAPRARLIGVLAAVVGVVALLPANRSDLAPAVGRLFVPLPGVELAAGATAILGVALLMLGHGVARGRRAALNVSVLLLIVVSVSHFLNHMNPVEGVVTGAAALVLLANRRSFVAVPPARRWSTVAASAGVLLVVDALASVAVVRLTYHHAPPLHRFVRQAGARLVGMPGHWPTSGVHGHGHALALLTLLGALTVVVLIRIAVAPDRWPGPAPDTLRRQARELAQRRDGDTLDPFVLRRDKSYAFSPDGRAVIGYRTVHGVGLASGDPVGTQEAFPAAVEAFLEVCARNGWRPAFYGTRRDRGELYSRLGLRMIYIGDEAVIDVAGFSLEGRRMRGARQAVSRTHNFGVSVEQYGERALPADLRSQLLEIAVTQRGHRPEHGYSMALGEVLVGSAHADCVVFVARDRDGRPVAFQRYVPCRAGTAISLDLMRRTRSAPNGTHERLIVEAVRWARDNGIQEVSLNFVAFRRGLDHEDEHRVGDPLSRWIVRLLEGHWGVQIDSLRRFNRKFRPIWVPRCLVYESFADLPAVGLATFSAEGFLPLDRGRQRETAPVPV